MKTIPFGAWEPDRALFGGQQLFEASGVMPSASGYVPFPALVAELGLAPLPGVCRGSISFYDSIGNALTVAGTDNALYLLDGGAWVLLGGDYLQTQNGWDFARYGNILIAVNGAEIPQYATIGAGTISHFAPIEGAPVGSSVEVVREFVIIGGIDKTKIQWSAVGSPLDWPAPGSNDAQYKQADEQDFPDTGSAVAVAGALSGLDILVFTERAIHRGRYSGTPYIFQFDILDKGRGAIAARSVITGDNAIYFLSEQGFFATNGSEVKNIGLEKINMWFRRVSDDTRRHETRGAVDPYTGIIVWTFAGQNAPPNVHNYALIYHPQLDRWSYAYINSTNIFSDLSRGKTLEDLNSFGDLENFPFSLDSVIFKGGVPGLAAFGTNNELGWFAGAPVAASLITAEAGGKRMMIHGVRPLIDGAKAKVSIIYRYFQHSSTHNEEECSEISDFDGMAHTHISTRYVQAKINIEAGEIWSFAIGCELMAEDEGGI